MGDGRHIARDEIMRMAATMVAAVLLGSAASADAQTSGFYLGGFAGSLFQNGDPDETVEFDTDLDEEFGDLVRTVAGADAFSPGFCAGLATGPTPASECEDDEEGFVLGGRVGYDWRRDTLLFGVVGDVSWPEVTDGVSAFSTTPAFYAFTRELNVLAGLRGRVGVGNDTVMVYGTAGVAFGWVEHSFSTSNAVNTFVPVNRNDNDDDEDDEGEDEDGERDGTPGYQMGAGVEFRLSDRVFLTGEYLFTSLDDRDDGIIRAQGPAPAGNPFLLVDPDGTDLTRSDRFAIHAVTVGVNFRF
jgi:opacity protein-like surface antigen